MKATDDKKALTMEVNFNKLPAFSCNAEDIGTALERIVAITDYAKSSGTQKEFVLATDENRLVIFGFTSEVISYLCLPVTTTVKGICSIELTDLVGLLKKRKGNYSFKAKDGNFSFENDTKSYKGEITLKELTSDVPEHIEDLRAAVKGTPLNSKLLTELKKAVKAVSSKHVLDSSTILPVHISCKDSKLVTATDDTFHSIVYKSKVDFKNTKDFLLSIQGQAYNVIDKFLASQSISFALSNNTLQIVKQDTIYASIPPTQPKEGDYDIFDNIAGVLTADSFTSEFTI